jgi:hypothetical protein
MRLYELFDKVAKWEWTYQSDKIYVAKTARLELTIEFFTSEHDQNEWNVSFLRGKTVKPTGTGNEFEIFSTVLAVIADFIQERQPEAIAFTAADTASRVKLYNRMVSKFAATNGFTVTTMASFDHETDVNFTDYVLTRKNNETL